MIGWEKRSFNALLSVLFAVLMGLSAATVVVVALRAAQYSSLNPVHRQTIQSLQQLWDYSDDVGTVAQTDLPVKVPYEEVLREITLENTLPDVISPGDVLWFSSVAQQVDISIDGGLRLSFGDADAHPTERVLKNPTHYMAVPLEAEDAGKPVKVVISSWPAMTGEIKLISDVQIGARHLFVLRDLADNVLVLFTVVFAIVTLLVMLFLFFAYRLRKKSTKVFVTLSFGLAMWVMFSATDLTVLWHIFNYSPALSFLFDGLYYLFDTLVAPMIFMMLAACDKRLIEGKLSYFILVVFAVAIVGRALFLLDLSSINLMRVYVTAPFIVISGAMAVKLARMGEVQNRTYAIASLVLMAGYALDYLKYALYTAFFSGDVFEMLYFNTPYMFFQHIAIIVFCVMLLTETIREALTLRLKAESELDVVNLQIEMYRNRYEQVEQGELATQRYRHDITHHLRSVAGLLDKGETAKARGYLADLAEEIGAFKQKSFCDNEIINIVLSWFADKAQEQGVEFYCKCNVAVKEFNYDKQICGVLSNILQNALDAQEAVQGDRYINISIKHHKNLLIINCENPFDGRIAGSPEQLLTRKIGKGHGLGLQNTRDFVNDSGGRLNVTVHEFTFNVEIVINGVVNSQ